MIEKKEMITITNNMQMLNNRNKESSSIEINVKQMMYDMTYVTI